MRPASSTLINLLNSGQQFIMVDLYTFTLFGGTVFRFSDAPTAITANGFTFVLGPKFERSKVKVNTGVTVDQFSVQVYPEQTDTLGSLPFLEAIWQGQLDGALLQVERAFMGASSGQYGDTTAGTVVLFAGRISTINCSRTGAIITCKSHLELLNINMPRHLWMQQCPFVFGDAMCGYDRVNGLNALGQSTGNPPRGAVVFAAASGTTAFSITGAPTIASTPFVLGTLISTSGPNNGFKRSVSSFTLTSNGSNAGVVGIKTSFLNPINVGDTFQMLPGCDRSLGTCMNIFNNAQQLPTQGGRFGGAPFIPAPETAI